jgi:predicted nuclease of predicted toxin-antitoxin system
MKIVLDESVSYGLAEVLLRDGHQIVAIAESATSGNSDEEVFALAGNSKSVLITRDYHFTNPLRFPSEKTGGIIYIRHGNLTSEEEILLVTKFLSNHPYSEFSGRLATLYRDSVKIR